LGVLGVAVGQIAQTLGVRLILASVATVVSALIPLFVVALAAVRLHQPMTAAQAAGFAAALGGVALVAGGDPRALAASFTRLDARAAPGAGPSHAGLEGVALVLISAAAVALYYVCSIALIEEYSVPTVAALSSLAGAAVLAPIAAWELGHAPVRLTAVSAGVVLYLALAVTVAGLWVWFGALSRLPAAIPAALQYLQPIVGVLASAALFGDRLDAWFWSGTGLVLAGIGMAARPGMRPSAGARGAAPAEAPGRL
jgi:drug/metabolite transporter (DMT)-like permease